MHCGCVECFSSVPKNAQLRIYYAQISKSDAEAIGPHEDLLTIVERPKTDKAREPIVDSLVRGDLEAEGIGSRAESAGGCMKLKIITEIRRSSARDT